MLTMPMIRSSATLSSISLSSLLMFRSRRRLLFHDVSPFFMLLHKRVYVAARRSHSQSLLFRKFERAHHQRVSDAALPMRRGHECVLEIEHDVGAGRREARVRVGEVRTRRRMRELREKLARARVVRHVHRYQR